MTLGSRILRAPARALFAGLLILTSSPQLRALTINLTYDSTVTALPNAAQYMTATNYAAAQLESIFTDNITINITVMAVAGTSVFGESGFGLVGSSYTQVRNALISHAVSANDTTSLGDLPAVDPTGGGSFFVNRAEAKALGIIGASALSDGTFYFGTGYSFALDPANRAVSGKYDFVGVAMHEMTEIMGRAAGLGVDFGNGQPGYIPYDLFRYSAPSTRSLIEGNNNYFSINSGTTNLKTFNFPNGNGSDPQDWASGTNDSCNNSVFPGVLNAFSAVDIEAMDVIGYTVAAAPVFANGPPPSSATISTAYTFTYTASPTGIFAVATGSLPPGLTLSTGGVLSGTPTQVGSYSGTVSITNGTGSVTQVFNISVGPASQPLAYSSWQSLYFTAPQMADPTISGPSATPQGDGIPNLLKYLTNINPSRSMTAADRAALPKVTFNAAGTTMTLTYRQFSQQTNLTITPQVSTDLQNWSPAGTATANGTDGVTGDPLMQLQVSVSGNSYYRLRVTSP